MNTVFLALIVIGIVLVGSFSYVYALMYDCLNPPIWMKIPRFGFDHCWGLLVTGHLPDYSEEREKYEEKKFNQTMKQKVNDAFDMTLEKYRINSKQLTVVDGFRWNDEFFMAESIAYDGNRYFLMAVFAHDVPADRIDVQIFQIVSDKCTTGHIQSKQGCAPEYIQELEIPDSKVSVVEQPVRICAYVGFEKYPEGLFADFLKNPYNKDVTFLNFTNNDLKQIPEFYKLILQYDQMDYPLNDRVRFTVSPEEHNVIKNHLEQRTYSEFSKDGKTITHQVGERDVDGNYRTPRILMDGKLYSTNGLVSPQVFSDRDVNMNIQYSGTLEDVKTRFIENDNPNKANLIYFEINEGDKIPLVKVLDAISKIHKSQDKIHVSEDVGSAIQNNAQDFFLEQNKIQFNNDETKYTKYFIFNGTMYETSFVVC